MREMEVLGYVYENGKVVVKSVKLLLGDNYEENQDLRLETMIKLYLSSFCSYNTIYLGYN